MSKTQAQPKAVQTQTVEADPVQTPLLDQAVEQTARRIDAIATNYTSAIARAHGQMEKALLEADGLEKLRQAITPDMMQKIMRLMNYRNGFMTDRGKERDKVKEPYPEKVVKECFIDSLLQGLRPVGNEWNIIAGQCFATQAAWWRKLTEIPGISDIDVVPGVPRMQGDHALVRIAVAWKLDGVRSQLKDAEGKPGMVFAIAINQYSGFDQVIGKGLRRSYKLAYQKATGSVCTTDDQDHGVLVLERMGDRQAPPLGDGAPASRTQQVADRLGASRAALASRPTLDRITGLLRALDFQDEEFLALASKHGAPEDLSRASEEQARAVLAELETIQRQVDEESAAERAKSHE